MPDAGIMFTGDLVETGQFAIFPWFPPYDADVSGTRWIEVMQRLSAARPEVVVPGHNEIGGLRLLADVTKYLTELRDETWKRQDSAMSQEAIVEEVRVGVIRGPPGED